MRGTRQIAVRVYPVYTRAHFLDQDGDIVPYLCGFCAMEPLTNSYVLERGRCPTVVREWARGRGFSAQAMLPHQFGGPGVARVDCRWPGYWAGEKTSLTAVRAGVAGVILISLYKLENEIQQQATQPPWAHAKQQWR